MNSRQLTDSETRGLAALNDLGIPSVLIFLTATGLQKSILDATEPARAFLRRYGFHDYDTQAQGQDSKVILNAMVAEPDALVPTNVSLYRPATKSGDPRLWPSGLSRLASSGDVVLMGVVGGKIVFFNLSRHDMAHACSGSCALADFIRADKSASATVAKELLERLRDLAQHGPLRATCEGSTSIGRAIEAALGIQPNSDRKPDYNGIEIKSGRVSSGTRSTLFACVPDWDISACKSSAAILEECGYDRNGTNKLYCTVSSQKVNTQGLILSVDEAMSLLRESIRTDAKSAEIAVWRLPRLEDSLLNKHKETFWIRAESTRVHGIEHFHLVSVTHTKSPNAGQLSRLLADGGVTVDHLIKRKASGSVHERGPLFKVVPKRIPELFLGEPKKYDLLLK